MGCGVHEGQPQREHQRCPTKPSRVSSVLVCLWPIMTTLGRFRKIQIVSHPHLLKISLSCSLNRYIYKCTGTTIKIQGKVNAITLDSCKKVPKSKSVLGIFKENDDDNKVIILRLLLSSTQLSPAVTSSTVSLYRCRSRSPKRVFYYQFRKKPINGSYHVMCQSKTPKTSCAQKGSIMCIISGAWKSQHNLCWKDRRVPNVCQQGMYNNI